MKTNMLGEKREPQPITFEWIGDISKQHLLIKRAGRVIAMVSTNGWNNYAARIDFKVGEPFMNNIHDEFSLAELKMVIKEWERESK